MKLYKTTGEVDKSEDGTAPETRVSWQGSLTEASKARTALKKEGAHKPVSLETDVPTTKDALLEWLNKNVKS